MKNYFLLLTVVLLSFTSARAQTNVSGGIYSNTTWTLANSPYIVTDTIVVFPNVTLTIEPGVTVKFANNKRIELRQAQLIAEGTNSDSITFTSNNPSPSAGIYSGIYLNGGAFTCGFSYCNFRYAAIGIYATISDTLIINNSVFNNNITGLEFDGNDNIGFLITEVSLINLCTFKNNTSFGISYNALHASTIDSCNFLYNGVGLNGGFFNTRNSIATHCIFNYNSTGLAGILNLIVDSCSIMHNQTGINSGSENVVRNSNIDSNSVIGVIAIGDSVLNCDIKYNGGGIATKASIIMKNDIEFNVGTSIGDYATWSGSGSMITGNTIKHSALGIDNSTGYFVITQNDIENNNIGIKINNSNSTINCNKICNNSAYGLQNETNTNIDASHNYWCTADSASIAALIYDGYDNINYGLVSFMPIDSLCTPIATAINEIFKTEQLISIYPNPFSNQAIIHTDKSFKSATLTIFNEFGQQVKQINNISGQTVTLFRDKLANGLYFIRMTENNKVVATGKFVIEN